MDDLRALVKYMYTGRCSNRSQNRTLFVANALGCDSLIRLIESEEAQLYKNVDLENPDHAQELLEAIHRFKTQGKFIDCLVSSQVNIFIYIL